MTQRERMDKGLIYDPGDSDIMNEQTGCLDLLYDFNDTRPSEGEKRQALLKKMFGSIGEGCYIEPPLRANWAGKNVYMGDYFGPNVTVATANHPIDPELRERMLQYNKEVRIGNNVWIGTGVIIVPGVTIGDNSVIGAGSIVTKDIPADVVAYGNPCRVIRKISQHDREFFYKNERIDWENLGL